MYWSVRLSSGFVGTQALAVQRDGVASDVAEMLLLALGLASALHVWLNSVRTLSCPEVSLANSLYPRQGSDMFH